MNCTVTQILKTGIIGRNKTLEPVVELNLENEK